MKGSHKKQEKPQSQSLWKRGHKDRKLDKMQQQRNVFHMREQDENLGEQKKKLETGNLLAKEFREIIVKIIQDLGKRMKAKTEKI